MKDAKRKPYAVTFPKHRQEFPREVVMCKYTYHGCDATLPREEMIDHHQDNLSHAYLSMLKHNRWYYCVHPPDPPWDKHSLVTLCACTRGKIIDSVIVVVVHTKIVRSQDLCMHRNSSQRGEF